MARTAAALRDADTPGLRDHLVRVTQRLIAGQRTEGLTVRRIAQEARVASGVLYNYFTDKEDLLAQGLLAHIAAVERTLNPPPRPGQDSLEANLAAYLRYLLDLHEQILPAFAGLLTQPKVLARFNALPAAEKGGNLHQHLTAHLRAEQHLGRLAPQLDPDAAATLIVGACYELVLPRLFQQATTDPLDVPTEFITSLINTVLDPARP
jgi:AcrR family transcriptional regulator